MKHIKLFEEFKTIIKYECAKPLPVHRIVSKSKPSQEDTNTHDTYFINTDDPEKLAPIEAELRKQGYDLKYVTVHDINAICWYSDTRNGQDMRVNVFQYENSIVPTSVQIELKFEDYFKFKPEYRGHNMKKFGV